VFRFIWMLLLSAVLASCGKKAENATGVEKATEATGARPAVVEGELVPLRLKRIGRSDRLPPSGLAARGKNGFGLTELDAGGAPSDLAAMFEPGADWESERLAQAAAAQLKLLEDSKFSEVLAEGVRCKGLYPPTWGELWKFEPAFKGGSANRVDASSLGARAMLTTTEKEREGDPPTFSLELADLYLKIVGIELAPETFTTRVYFEAGKGLEGGQQITGHWSCEWTRSATPPRILSIRIEDYEQVASLDRTFFREATQSVLEQGGRFDLQVMRGIEYWAQRLTRIGDMSMTGHHGLAVGDVNGDGLEDLYVCDAGSLPNQLYLQQPDGTAKEVAAAWGIDWLEDSRSALLVDLDSDGDQDLVVATIAMIAFAENDGEGKFVLRGGHPGAPYPFSLSAADFDNDGDLDIYACVYGAGDEALTGKRGFEARSPIPFNDANNGGKNVLLENLGEFGFADATDRVGLGANNTRWSFAAAWEDFDRDGDADLYVANDFGRNCLYRNDGGQFTEVAAELGVEDMAAGMSVAWGDYNRDGAADLYVGNMFSAAGSRVAYNRNFDAGMKRMARGNTLFEGSGGGKFSDVGEELGVSLGGWAWSSALVDVNNNGWEDVVVANGYLTNSRDDDL
jgi:hypothetical protein